MVAFWLVIVSKSQVCGGGRLFNVADVELRSAEVTALLHRRRNAEAWRSLPFTWGKTAEPKNNSRLFFFCAEGIIGNGMRACASQATNLHSLTPKSTH